MRRYLPMFIHIHQDVVANPLKWELAAKAAQEPGLAPGLAGSDGAPPVTDPRSTDDPSS